jgi:hypothetical protein
MNKLTRDAIELSVMEHFSDRHTATLLTKELFQALPQYANADLVRAFEDLEKTKRLIIRYTQDGDDWISLTNVGVERVGMELGSNENASAIHPHPPRSSTPS